MLIALYFLPHLNLLTTLSNRNYYFLHVRDEKIQAYTNVLSILASYCCCDKLPSTGWFETISSRSQKSKMGWQGFVLFLKLQNRICFFPFSSIWRLPIFHSSWPLITLIFASCCLISFSLSGLPVFLLCGH